MNGGLWILVVDADQQMRRFLQCKLTANGYCIYAVGTGQATLAKLAQIHPDLIILDLDLPDMQPLSLLTLLRERTKVPLLVTSMHATSAEQIAALDAGADDFLTKPLRIDELLARIRVALRHLQPNAQSSIFTHGDLQVDLTRRLVTIKGERVKLTPHEYAILRLLVQNVGIVLTHRQILSTVWGPAHANETHYGRVYIAQLRQKLETNPQSPQLILTEPRIGYRLTLPDPSTRPR